jgi:hypothetical protein
MFRGIIYLAALALPVAIYALFGIAGILSCVVLAWLTLAISTDAEVPETLGADAASLHPHPELTARS